MLRRAKDQFISETPLDISNGGLALQTAEPLTVGQLEELVLTSNDRKTEVMVQVEVVHVRPSGHPDQFVNGLRFAYLDAAAASKIEAVLLQAMETPSGSRAGARLSVQAEGFWSEAGGTSQVPVELINAGLGGALLQTAELPALGSLGLLSVRPIDDTELVAVPGRVIWARKETQRALVGLAFDRGHSSREFVLALVESLLFSTRAADTGSAQCRPGTVIGGFELQALLARGRSSEIYRARTLDPMGDAAGSAEVALRRFVGPPPDVELWTERFLAAQDVGRNLLTLPGVLRVYAAAGDRNECWLATELLIGASFDRVLSHFARSGRNAPVGGVLSVMVEALRTLDACHTLTLREHPAPVVHGDLRPSNVLIGNAGDVKLIGFGVQLKGLQPREVRVTPYRLPYLPPELFVKGGDSSPAGDVYQAGVLLYEALTCITPFPVRSADHLEKAVQRGPVAPSRLNPNVSGELERVVLAALSADPAARPASAKLFADQLAALEACPSETAASTIERVGLVDATRRRLTRSIPRVELSNSMSIDITLASRPALGESGSDAPTELRTEPGPSPGSSILSFQTITARTKPSAPAPPQKPALDQAPPPATLAEWKPRRAVLGKGDVLGRYEVLGKLAQGGMAEVYLARAQGPAGFAKTVVLKTILPTHDTESEFVKLFLNEARVAAVINHANIVQLFDFGFDRGRPYIVMEYLEGRNLAQVMGQLQRLKRRMPPPIAARIVAECCAALDYAHHLKDSAGNDLNIVHRDVSSKNILLAYSGQVKLLDFGIAKTSGTADITMPGMVRGTIGYLSPEQARGQAPTAQVDVWALGINLYTMLTGSPPFDGDNVVEVMREILLRALPLAHTVNPDAPEVLARIAQKALEKPQADRYATAAQMRADAEEYLKTQPASAYDLSALMESLFPARAHPERVRMSSLAAGLSEPEPEPEPEATLPQPPPLPARAELERSTQVTSLATPDHKQPTRKQYARALALGLLAGLVAAAAMLVIFTRGEPVVQPGGSSTAPARVDAGTPAVVAAVRDAGALEEADAADEGAQAPTKGSLRITCNVPCTVALDGRIAGATPFDLSDVAEGKRRVRLVAATANGRSTRDLEVDVVAGHASRLNETFGTGTLQVTARPGAEVFLEGRSYGFTPVTAQLLEGPHEVMLVNKKLKAKRHRAVVIKPDHNAELSVDMIR